ncbi:MAG: LPS export ABC transporter periplasmic protein LptC [Pleurocapsa sp.]
MKIINFTVRSCFPLLLFGIVACQQANIDPPTSALVSRTQTQLILNNAILEQSNPKDNTVWKIQAKSSIYTEDKQAARLQTVTANFLQNNRMILKLSADGGEVRDNGNLILLQGNIVAQDIRNGIVVKSEELEWRPTEHLLAIRQNPVGIHPNLEVKATEGKYFTNTQSLELQGNIIATTREPALQLKSDRAVWQIPQQILNSPLELQIVRYQKDASITDRLVADGGRVNLNTHTVNLNNNIELVSFDPQLQMATNSLIWNYETRTINADQPIQIIDRQHNIDVTGNQAKVDLNQNIVHLKDGVKGINHQDNAQIYASQLVWQIDTKAIEAIGNVTYQQSNPQISLTGEKAVGKLAVDKIIVTGEGSKQVTTTIINK